MDKVRVRYKELGLFFIEKLHQSYTQSPLSFWSAVGRQERLWGTGILLPQDSVVKQCKPLCGSQSKNLNVFEFSRISPGD